MPPMRTRFPVPVGPNSHITEGAPLPGANETLFLAPVGPRRATNGTLSAAPGPSQPARGQPAPNPHPTRSRQRAVPFRPGSVRVGALRQPGTERQSRRSTRRGGAGRAEPPGHPAGLAGALWGRCREPLFLRQPRLELNPTAPRGEL